jgi:hypothetical protein
MEPRAVGIEVLDNLLVILQNCFANLEPCFQCHPDYLGRLTTFDGMRDVAALEQECYVSL